MYGLSHQGPVYDVPWNCCTEADETEITPTTAAYAATAEARTEFGSQHAVENRYRDGRFSLLAKPVARTKPRSDNGFVGPMVVSTNARLP